MDNNNGIKNSSTNSLRYILLFALCFLLFGFFSALMTDDAVSLAMLNRPPFAPPPQLFAVAWSILYVIIGSVTGAVFAENNSELYEEREYGLSLSCFGFMLNLMWYPLFFGSGELLAALIDIGVIFILNLVCLLNFYKIKKAYGLLLIPYSLWLAFAFYLNFGYILLN